MIKIPSFLIIIFLLALLPVSTLFAQDEQTAKKRNLKLAFEFGGNEAGSKIAEHERIRKDNYSNNGTFGGRRHHSFSTTYFGVKPEFFVANNRLGIASGLRFTVVTSEYFSGREKFLWKAEENGLNTSYFKLENLRQKSHLVGVPIEVRFFLNNRELPFQFYLKAGASFNYRISYENSAEFVSKVMNRHKNLVESQLSEEENAFSSFAYTSIGFKIGKFREGSRMPWGNFEFTLPYFLLTNRSFAFAGNGINDNPGIGVQLSLQFPIGKNAPIGSN